MQKKKQQQQNNNNNKNPETFPVIKYITVFSFSMKKVAGVRLYVIICVLDFRGKSAYKNALPFTCTI